MSNQIVVPSLGESVTEATVSKWLKQVGETVDSDEPLVELETDKVNVEVPSPLSGTLSSIKVKEGDTVEVGSVLGLVNTGKKNLSKENEIETGNYTGTILNNSTDITMSLARQVIYSHENWAQNGMNFANNVYKLIGFSDKDISIINKS